MDVTEALTPSYWRANYPYYYYRYLASYQNVSRRSGDTDEPTLAKWISTLVGFERVVAVAAGPSASLMVRSPHHLYIPTNSAIRLTVGHPHVYFISESAWVYQYLKRGVSSRHWLGTVIREEVNSGSPAIRRVAKAVAEYKAKYVRERPEIFASDLHDDGLARVNYEYLERAIQQHLDMKFKQFNSGFGAVQFAYCIAVALKLPMDIYGLDAGCGGSVHFDGTKSIANSISGERVRMKLIVLLQALYAQSEIMVTNYSYFPVAGGAGAVCQD